MPIQTAFVMLQSLRGETPHHVERFTPDSHLLSQNLNPDVFMISPPRIEILAAGPSF